MSISETYNEDCMIGMARYPDKWFDLAVVDPPYFERGGDPSYYRSHLGTSSHKPIRDTWDIPNDEYFNELFRISERQIIWGVNYYAPHVLHCSRIVWDKCNDGTPFSQADIASYSEGVKVYMFRYKWNGMLQQNMANKEIRIHPTQKPVALYSWIYHNYLPLGGKVIDTHLGSGSNRIAADKAGNIDFYAWELDKDYFEAQEKRFKDYKSQLVLEL